MIALYAGHNVLTRGLRWHCNDIRFIGLRDGALSEYREAPRSSEQEPRSHQT